MPEKSEEESEQDRGRGLGEQEYPPGSTNVLHLSGEIVTKINIDVEGDPILLNKIATMALIVKAAKKKEEDSLEKETQEDTPEETPEQF